MLINSLRLPQRIAQMVIMVRRIASELILFLKFDPRVFPELNVHDYEEYYEIGAVKKCPLRVKLILEWIEPYSTVLDVGCGEGLVAEEIAKKRKCEIYGIDISAKAIQKFIDKGFHGEVRDIDQEGLQLESNYDYILLIEVLEHLKWPHKILLEACAHAKRGVIVTIPNSGYIRWRLQMLMGFFPRQTFTHLHFWSIKDFSLFLRTLGLRAIDFETELSGLINRAFGNLLAYQQCWLIASKSKL